MNGKLYLKLAVTNIKKNYKIYLPYILAGIFSVMMFYILVSLSFNTDLENMSLILGLGVVVLGIFSTIIILYTNSFLIKRRTKELGLYNILGMEKKHIGRVIANETAITSLICIGCGLFMGIVLEKLAELIILKLLSVSGTVGFYISKEAVLLTAAVYLVIYFIAFLKNLKQIHVTKPIELLRGRYQGEKEPKVKWLLVVLGIATLSLGYYIAIKTTSPTEAVLLFFVAVILVIIGTYCLFTAISIAVLKKMKKNKHFYYKKNNFTTVSGMLYRMKQNAVGLASICILSTMVLVTISTTVSLYTGMKERIKSMYARDVMVDEFTWENEGTQHVEGVIDNALEKHGLKSEDTIKFKKLSADASYKDGVFEFEDSLKSFTDKNAIDVNFVTLDDFNTVDNASEELEDNEVIVCGPHKIFDSGTINMLGQQFNIKKSLDGCMIQRSESMQILDSYFIVVKDMDTIESIEEKINAGGKNIADTETIYGFNAAGGSEEDVLAFQEEASDIIVNDDTESFNVYLNTIFDMKRMANAMYGGLLFVGILLGSLFLLATVLIIYYKQISEGYDDRSRFEIMQKVGMSKREVKKTIHSQILMVFFLPVAAAIMHICFAAKFIRTMLICLGMNSTKIFAECTITTVVIFAAVYAVVYLMTSKAYYGIVNQKYEY